MVVLHAGVDSVKAAVEPLASFCDSPLKLGMVFTAAVDDAGEHSFRPLALEQALFDIIGDRTDQKARKSSTGSLVISDAYSVRLA